MAKENVIRLSEHSNDAYHWTLEECLEHCLKVVQDPKQQPEEGFKRMVVILTDDTLGPIRPIMCRLSNAEVVYLAQRVNAMMTHPTYVVNNEPEPPG